jgi:hypothetical protein
MKLGQMKDGRYFRNVGYLESGSQPKFYLGRDGAEAFVRGGKVEQIWRLVVADFLRSEQSPHWFGFALELAKAVAEGRVIEHLPEGWIGRLAQIGIATTSPEALATGKIQTFGKAVQGYIEAVKETHPTLWGTGKIRLVEFVAERVPDFVLNEFDMDKIDGILRLLASRPVSEKTGEPVSVSWAKNTIKEFRQFIRWLHKKKSYGWRRPEDYEVLPVRVGRTQDERARITSLAVETFSLDELMVLWRYALPWERLLMTLGLNCGFGMAEIATLCREEVLFAKPHPFAEQIGLCPAHAPGDWIMRLRGKSEVYGEWKLWDVTVAALQWIIALRPHPERIVVPKGGGELHKKAQRNNQIANSWQRLLDRIEIDKSTFPRRSFNKLRKTGINLVRQHAGEEVASLFASHGKPVHDELIRVYANPRWVKLHATTDSIRLKLDDIFKSVSEPFRPVEVRGGPNISLGRIEQIKKLVSEGKRICDVASEVGVSRETVRRWATR